MFYLFPLLSFFFFSHCFIFSSIVVTTWFPIQQFYSKQFIIMSSDLTAERSYVCLGCQRLQAYDLIIYPLLFRVYLKDTDGQSQGIPCVLQKFNKDGSLSDESPGLMVRCHSSRLIQSYLLTHFDTFCDLSGAPNENIVQNHLNMHCWSYFSI